MCLPATPSSEIESFSSSAFEIKPLGMLPVLKATVEHKSSLENSYSRASLRWLSLYGAIYTSCYSTTIDYSAFSLKRDWNLFIEMEFPPIPYCWEICWLSVSVSLLLTITDLRCANFIKILARCLEINLHWVVVWRQIFNISLGQFNFAKPSMSKIK